MIKVSSKKNKYTYNVYHLVKAFFPNEEIIQNVDEKQESLVVLNLPAGNIKRVGKSEKNERRFYIKKSRFDRSDDLS